MIEAKDKEQAVMELHRIYSLQPTIHASLRPPVDVETLRTQGRKSSKKKKKALDAEEGEELDQVDPEDVLVDIDGAEVLPPVELGDGEQAKPTPRKRTKRTEATTPTPKEKKPAKPRKSRAKKVKADEDSKVVKNNVKSEPMEAQPIEVG